MEEDVKNNKGQKKLYIYRFLISFCVALILLGLTVGIIKCDLSICGYAGCVVTHGNMHIKHISIRQLILGLWISMFIGGYILWLVVMKFLWWYVAKDLPQDKDQDGSKNDNINKGKLRRF